MEAKEIAARLFGGHPAAAPLMIEAIHGPTLDRRERSRLALRLLDPTETLNYLVAAPEGPAWVAAQAIAYLLVANVSAGSRLDRRRVAGLLEALCREASRITAIEGAA